MPSLAITANIHGRVHADQVSVVGAEKAVLSRLMQAVCALVSDALVVLLDRELLV